MVEKRYSLEKKKKNPKEDNADWKELEAIFEYDLDRECRVVYFNGDVDESMVDRTIKSLCHLDSQSDKPIILKICSYGGSVDLMFALYDVIRQCRSHITTVGTGAICSAAVLLLACGDERHATENSWLMAHRAKGGSFGDSDEVGAQAEAFKKYEDKRYKLLARHSKWSAKKWRDKEAEKGEVWMEPKEMLQSGVVDKIVYPTKVKKKK